MWMWAPWAWEFCSHLFPREAWERKTRMNPRPQKNPARVRNAPSGFWLSRGTERCMHREQTTSRQERGRVSASLPAWSCTRRARSSPQLGNCRPYQSTLKKRLPAIWPAILWNAGCGVNITNLIKKAKLSFDQPRWTKEELFSPIYEITIFKYPIRVELDAVFPVK